MTDLVRDVVALFLLFGALALPWDVGHDASDRWWVVIATVISALSLIAPYLVSMEVVPGFAAPQSRLVKYACAVPYLISVFAALVNELAHLTSEEGGVGVAVAVGLVGALLAMQARVVDEEPSGVGDGYWRTATLVLIGVGLVAVTITLFIFTVTNLDDVGSSFAGYNPKVLLIGYSLGLLAAVVVTIGVPFVGFLSGTREWARVLAVVGFVMIGSDFLGGASDSADSLFASVTLEFFKVVIGLFLVAAGIALLVSRPVQRRLASLDAIGTWVATARHACVAGAAALLAIAVARLLLLIGESGVHASSVIQLVLTVLAAGALLLVQVLLGGNPDHARRIVVAVAGGVILVGIVAIAVGRGDDAAQTSRSITFADSAGFFGLPALVLWAMLVPEAIRTSFQPIAPHPAQQGGQVPPPPPQGYTPPPPPQGYTPPPPQP
ncbi:MAG: hypothetical protein ACJ72E_01410 [Marmoricola sp.]